MRVCPKCGMNVPDDAGFCTSCGERIPLGEESEYVVQQELPVVRVSQADQFQTNSCSIFKPENPCDKLLGIVALFGFIGVLFAYFGGDVDGRRSDYLRFYVNEGLVISLFSLFAIIPFIGWLWSAFVLVCKIIAIVYACRGETTPVLFFGTLRLIK